METMRFDQWRKEIEKFLSGDFKVQRQKRKKLLTGASTRMVRVMFWFMLVHVFPPIMAAGGFFAGPKKTCVPCRPGGN